MLTQQELKRLLHYDYEMDVWTRKTSRGCREAGTVTGTRLSARGYREIKINKRYYFAHRLTWLYVHGEWPKGEVDHINGKRHDNRIGNLREATKSENQRNRGANSNNKSGLKGVSWKVKSKRWVAQISLNHKKIHLGYFTSQESAHAAYCQAAIANHGEFVRTT